MPTRGWNGEIKLSECQDNPTLIAALRRLWESRPAGEEYEHPYFIGVHLERPGSRPAALAEPLRRARRRAEPHAPARAMDELNNKYGMSTLAPATMLTAYKAAPTRIAFHSIPDLF